MKYYAGIGSRNTPTHTLELMRRIARKLRTLGYILRSGAADGADTAFESGSADMKQIFLPWPGFNGSNSMYHQPSNEAYVMAEKYHPNWAACGRAARAFHARNCHQVLGPDLNSPVDFVVCWTPNAQVTGGTGQAIRIAMSRDIPVINLASPDWQSQIRTAISASTEPA